MTLREFIKKHFPDFNIKVKTEEDLKIKVIVPYLYSLGYDQDSLRFENTIPVQVGSKTVNVRSDIEVLINGNVQLVIDAKKPTHGINERDIIQSISYAKLINTPPAIYAVATNGIDCIVTNVFTGQRLNEIPTKSQILRDLDKTVRKPYTEIQLREVRSALLTILNPDELYKVINKCKDIIEKKGLIRSDQSFREMTKILLVKMNEERRVKIDEGDNRFLVEYFDAFTKANNVGYAECMKSLFNDAKRRFPNIYNHEDENLRITDDECIYEIVKQLEPFSFLGTGDDIKGAVYEIFLKSTLRGDFDQYFTPREIVDFMVKFADPCLGDIVLDPACGSGGFLIQVFKHVNQKIIDGHFSEKEAKRQFDVLVEKCLWGNEADYDLHVLAKINLIMHGDGWNNIYQGDTLTSSVLPVNYFDKILTNPPFTIKYEFPDTLSLYELGLGKDSEELDILFVEKAINLLKEGGDLLIILPEGLLNNKRYLYFREFLLKNSFITLSISLPEGAFIPFGGSVSKTCILGLRKKGTNDDDFKPNHVFLGKAIEVGYEVGKKLYKIKEKNDLLVFSQYSQEVFSGIKTTPWGGECAWITQDEINSKRLDASYLLNLIDREELKRKFKLLVPLKDICDVSNITINLESDKEYYYLEVPDISPETGLISNIRLLKGEEINSSSLHQFFPGDILFVRINPRKNRISIVPPFDGTGVVSKEVYRLTLKENPYIKYDVRYCLVPILQSEHVKNQIVRLSTGSSSSRARVQEEDLLENVFIPIPDFEIQQKLHDNALIGVKDYWNAAQALLESYVESHNMLGSCLNKNNLRTA